MAWNSISKNLISHLTQFECINKILSLKFQANIKWIEQTIASQQQTIILQNDYIENLKTDKDRLLAENDQLRTELEDIRQRELDDVKRPWWSRLFGKK